MGYKTVVKADKKLSIALSKAIYRKEAEGDSLLFIELDTFLFPTSLPPSPEKNKMRFEPTLFVSVFFICHVAPEDNEEGKKGQLLSWGTRQQTRRKIRSNGLD